MPAEIRKCLSEHAAIMIYKFTILPYMEYAGFLLSLIPRMIDGICKNVRMML